VFGCCAGNQGKFCKGHVSCKNNAHRARDGLIPAALPSPGRPEVRVIRYARPTTLNEAVAILAEESGTLLSGGTDFYPSLGDRPFTGTVVDISRVREMKAVTSTPDEIRIGGLTTWSELLSSPLPRCYSGLKSAAREIGGVQIQNRGTVAGNLCNASPAADSVPPLLALDAAVELLSKTGSRRMMLADFIVGNRKTLRRRDEILTAVVVPREMDEAASVFLKLGARRYLVISIVMVAAVVKIGNDATIEDARIAVGSCSTCAQRLTMLEQDLVGAPADSRIGVKARPEHLRPLSPIDDLRATANYRSDAALTLVARALNACVGNC
jgi:CO/xanthine dehydrogenase FAD-binding subunit